jgi:uncharacterized protein
MIADKSERSADDGPTRTRKAVTSVKIVIAGSFGVGKTTFVGSASDVRPMTTEAVMTTASNRVDVIERVPFKETTTVAMDFGRVQLADDLLLYLFGTPGQERFWFMWDNLVRGAIGAVVLVDSRRLAESFMAVDYFDNRQLPYVIAVNAFDGILHHSVESVRKALALDPSIPALSCDARDRQQTRKGLLSLLEHAITQEERRDAEPSFA